MSGRGVLAVVGAGHVGVVHACGFAELGHVVRVVDVNEGRLKELRAGRVWFHEPGLDELLVRGIAAGRLTFTTSYKEALNGASFAFVCVPTPTSLDGSLDDSALRCAFEGIRESARDQALIVVNKSTAPVGTGDAAARLLSERGLDVVSSPEFLAEGTAVRDFFKPARIVIGAHRRAAALRVRELYSPLTQEIVITDPTTAELSKLAANAFLATKISFANAIAQICSAVGGNARDLTQALGSDPRIGPSHLNPGLGYGGSCLPKDLAAVEHLARRSTGSGDLFRAVANVNRSQRARVVDILADRLGTLVDQKIAVLGIAFKSGTDDTRDSPGLALAVELAQLHASVRVYDPLARTTTIDHFTYVDTVWDAVRGADAAVVTTDAPEFVALDLAALRQLMQGDLLVDGRGVIAPHAARAAGFALVSLVPTDAAFQEDGVGLRQPLQEQAAALA